MATAIETIVILAIFALVGGAAIGLAGIVGLLLLLTGIALGAILVLEWL